MQELKDARVILHGAMQHKCRSTWGEVACPPNEICTRSKSHDDVIVCGSVGKAGAGVEQTFEADPAVRHSSLIAVVPGRPQGGQKPGVGVRPGVAPQYLE
jgi:hypothetical protein